MEVHSNKNLPILFQRSIVYLTINLINFKIYVGKHNQEEGFAYSEFDDYLGKGTAFLLAIEKYGKENFVRIVLCDFPTEKEAYDFEERIVNEEFVTRRDTYNECTGGRGGVPCRSSRMKNSKTNKLRLADPKNRIEHTKRILSYFTNPDIFKKRNGKMISTFKSAKKRKEHSELFKKLYKDPRYEKMKTACANKISAEGIEYYSIREGARNLKISLGSMNHRLKSKNYPDYFLV